MTRLHRVAQVILGQRTIRLKEGGQCRWYDLPMTTAEALAAHPSVSLQIGPATMPGLHPRLDSLEVYAKPHSEINFTGRCEGMVQTLCCSDSGITHSSRTGE